jgi:hypothetical protein
MELFIPLMLLAFGAYILKSKDQARRIALLGSHLQKHQIEKLMESLTQGYLRALGESNPERQTQVWAYLAAAETDLCAQFTLFAAEFAKLDPADTAVSKLPIAIPYADKLFPAATFDMRQALNLHARALTEAANNSRHQSPKNKAFTLSAELFLMQHTCHWFCRSKTVASARTLTRHQTPYAQLLASVAPETRRAYAALVGA